MIIQTVETSSGAIIKLTMNFEYLHIHLQLKKVIWLTAVLVVLMLLMLPKPAYADAARFEEGTVTGQNVNMRLRPSVDSPVVCQIDTGSRIGIYCEYDDGWIRVIFGNYRGYIKRDLVFLPSEDSFQGNVFGDALRVHRDPAEYSDVITELPVGTPLTIKDIQGDWYYVSVNGEDETEGYVSKDFIKMSDDAVAEYYLAPGMTGSAVYNMQKELKKRNFYGYPCTGVYGPATQKAVRLFQDLAGLTKDGIASAETLSILYSDEDIHLEGAQAAGSGGVVLMSDWFTVVNERFKTLTPVTVVDVLTGKSYQVIRYAGTGHADVCPATPKDTAIMLETYGGEWSWDRRPVWVIINGVMYAASTNGMPHGVDYNSQDNMDGQVCIHFYNSIGHASGEIDPTHQACVEYAYERSKD